jgi:hypothetical protein
MLFWGGYHTIAPSSPKEGKCDLFTLTVLLGLVHLTVPRVLVRVFLVRLHILVRVFLVSYLTFSLYDRAYSYVFSLLVICFVTCQKRR